VPALISFSGLPGVGKTTVARALAQKIRAAYIRVDSIETALKNSSLQIHPAEDAGYLAAIAVAKDNLTIGLDVVADTVNPVELTRKWWSDVAEGLRCTIVERENCVLRRGRAQTADRRTSKRYGWS
jgi:predicted kinase